MNIVPSPRLLIVGASCAALGASAGVIASATAAGPDKPARAGQHQAQGGKHGGHKGNHGLMRRVVHADLVVAERGGTFGRATVDRGTVKSVSGDQLTLAEQARKATYKTVTLTIPADARVRDNRGPATLADVKPGQRAIVRQGPKQTLVRAHDGRRAG
ncbi:MAG: hypothetical protein ACR2NB_15645 [Solirubrobacteraceae bacterium]